jgi:hypothetical protein
MLSHDCLTEELGPVTLPFCLQNLVILLQLDLVVVNRLSQDDWIGHRVPILDIVQLLQAIDCDREYLAG